MSDAQLFDQLGEALKAQGERFGADAFDNRRRVISLLADTLPEARREIRAVATALDEGAVEALRGVDRSLIGMEMDRQADRLEQAVGLRPDLAKHVIRALAFALNLGPPPSVYEAAPVHVATFAAGQDWAGMSETTAPNVSTPPPISDALRPSAVGLQLDRVLFTLGGRAVTVLHAGAAALAAALVLFVAAPMVSGRAAAPRQQTALQTAEFAGELTDNGVPAKTTLESNVGSPTPISIPGAQRVTTTQLYNALQNDRNILLVDVLGDPHNRTIQGAHYVPTAGQGGTFTDAAQNQTVQALQRLTGGDQSKVIVFFCAGAACWESYNAVLRARAAGYSSVYWYRGGLRSWDEARLPFQDLRQTGD